MDNNILNENNISFNEIEKKIFTTKAEAGEKAYMYLLDREIGMDKIGLIFTNLAEKITSIVVESQQIETFVYDCQSVINGMEKRYQLKYIIPKCQW